jgi:LPPG:FO 2-phospho-L-lactate transferase
MIVALAGGVGGAKLAQGLSRVLSAQELAIVVNTGDDFEHLGLSISPDIDTVVYTLAGLANPVTGWGLAGESWSFMAALGRLGGETWFRLGDGDLATHVARGVGATILPVSDDPVRTFVLTEEGELAFQPYFVGRQCEPRLLGLTYRHAEAARPAPLRGRPWTDHPISGAVLCPSNPYLSIAPILAIPAVRAWMERRTFPVVAVSPILEGRAVKGPAAKIMRELGQEPSALGVARFYAGLVDAFVIDRSDAALADSIRALGMEPVVTDIVMRDLADRERLAREILALPLLAAR